MSQPTCETIVEAIQKLRRICMQSTISYMLSKSRA